MQNPKILVAGAGAVGTFYASKLHQAGAEVSVIARTNADKIRKKGYFIKSILGDFTFTPAQVLDKAADYQDKADYILVASKALPEINLPEMIRAAVSENTVIVLIQNGIDVEIPLSEAFPKNELISAVANIAVSRESATTVNHQEFGILTIGNYPSGLSDKAKFFATMLNKAGTECKVTDKILEARWKKLLWNAAYNSISVVTRSDTKLISVSPEVSTLADKIMHEVYNTAKAYDMNIPADLIEFFKAETLKMKPFKTSMLQDYEAGKPIEVEAITGNALRKAQKAGVETPCLQSMYGILKLLDTYNRKKLQK